MELVNAVLANVFSVQSILIVIVGTVVGIILGAIPGLNGGIGIALLLPVTYGMQPASALLLLGGIYMGGSYGGSVAGILLNVPGSGEAACTTIEGYPLSQKGQGREALLYSVLSSSIGGFVGVVALILFTPILSRLALQFGPPEYLLVALAGLTVVGSIAGNRLAKGLFAALFGIFLSMVGPDIVTGRMRFTFGIKILQGGIGLIPVIVGLFAITEMVKQAGAVRSDTDVKVTIHRASAFSILVDIVRRPMNVIKSSILGTIIGLIPGTGGGIASFVAYGEAKRTSKRKVPFGSGNADGIVASEAANNAAVGGSLVPLLSLGIPGSTTSAIIFGALTIHGLVPGISLFRDTPVITYTFLYGMLLTVLVMAIAGIVGIRLFALVLKADMKFIIPAVLVLSIVGAYSQSSSFNDVVIAVVFGAIGVVFNKVGIPVAPVILGLILGGIIERSLVQTLTIAAAREVHVLAYIFTRPLSVVIFVLFALTLFSNIRADVRRRRSEKVADAGQDEGR